MAGTVVTRLSVDYFDGITARAHKVHMWVDGGMLQLSGPGLIRQVALAKVQWSERTRHGARAAHFQDGGSVSAHDSAGWDAWLQGQGLGEPLVVKAQQSWRWTMLATVVLLSVTVLGYWWGLPLAARALTPLVPEAVDQQIGTATLHAMDDQWLHTSKLDGPQQALWQARFGQALQRGRLAWHASGVKLNMPQVQLHFRRASIGPNAFALPDGSIIVTDDLIELLQDREDVLLGVLGHELGHVSLRHGLRTLVQTGLLSAASGVAFGDFSSVLAGAPALMGHLAYSRDLEREADEAAVSFMRANGIRPSVMAVFFERMAQYRQRKAGTADRRQSNSEDEGPGLLGIALSSHPADAERVARFQAADLDERADHPGL